MYYDIHFINKKIKIECKGDQRMNYKNNCFIETSYKNRPNGIYDTNIYF